MEESKNKDLSIVKFKTEGYKNSELGALTKAKPVDRDAVRLASERQEYLVKVPGSLGKLEDISIRLSGITGKPYGNDVRNQAIILMCADNGVVDEGVASAPQTVTLMQTINFTKRITGVGSQAKYFGIDILTVDVGVKLEIPAEYLTEEMIEKRRDESDESKEEKEKLTSLIVNRRIVSGTRNLALEPAMSNEEVIKAIKIGEEAVDACKVAGKDIIGIGEMGIGNTTTATAIISMLAPLILGEYSDDQREITLGELISGVDNLVGRGGGLSNDGLNKKKKVIKNAIKKYFDLYMDRDGYINPLKLLQSVGGLDIAAMTGVYLRAASIGIPVVVDGVISIAAVLTAYSINPDVIDFIFLSHKSKESGYALAADALKAVEPAISPMYDLGMRLGEGSGCPIAFKIIEAACAVMNGMKSLEEAEVDSEYLEEFRVDGQFNRK